MIDIAAICRGVLERQRGAIGHAISLLENGHPESLGLLGKLRPHLGRAKVIGVTGAPGAGKSTLLGYLIESARSRGASVGVLLVDPSSPRTRGAVLGDRIRFRNRDSLGQVFTRSLASRGHVGGLTDATAAIVDVLDAAGFDTVFLETVGSGQCDVELHGIADLSLVLCPPGLGDGIQAIKAGILEIADILVVTKADRPGAETTRQQLSYMVEQSLVKNDQRKVLSVSSHTGLGMAGLVSEIDTYLYRGAEVQQSSRRRSVESIRQMITNCALQKIRNRALDPNDMKITAMCDRVARGEEDLQSAVEGLILAVLQSNA